MDRSVAIANEFLRKPGGEALTQMQLQKLVYIAHGWNLGLLGRGLTTDEPEAWAYGPVYPDLYDHTKFFGRGAIGREITPDDDEAARFFIGRRSDRKQAYRAEIDANERSIIDQVWSRYGSLSGARLSALTHQPNTPWSMTYDGRRNRSISSDVIRSHYAELAARARPAA